MILYFSGTGNSAYAAKFTADLICDQTLDLFDKIRNEDHSPMESSRPWVVASPVYSWQLPHVVRDWMRKTEFRGNKDIYFLITCGSSIGNAQKYAKQLCDEMGLNFKGCAEIVMPENYIALFAAPGEEKAERIINAAERKLRRTARKIKAGEDINDKPGVFGKLLSGAVNKCFYKLIVKDKKFYVKDSCTGCGLCEKKCPMANIKMEAGKPSWQGDCTHCMACISYCPVYAIEYGKSTSKKRRYVCPR